jgi:ABC-type molybdate transport system permease subunit
MGTITMFTLFLASALALRKKRDWHKRLMFLASLSLILPAAGRLDSLIMVPLGLPRAVIGFWLTLAFVTWAWANDWRKLRRIHPAYVYGGVALVASVPARRALGFTDAWLPIAQWLTGN